MYASGTRVRSKQPASWRPLLLLPVPFRVPPGGLQQLRLEPVRRIVLLHVHGVHARAPVVGLARRRRRFGRYRRRGRCGLLVREQVQLGGLLHAARPHHVPDHRELLVTRARALRPQLVTPAVRPRRHRGRRLLLLLLLHLLLLLLHRLPLLLLLAHVRRRRVTFRSALVYRTVAVPAKT